MRDRDTLSSCGFVQSCVPEALLKALERRYLKTSTPRNLSLLATAGQGDGKAGLNRVGHEGLLRKVVAGDWGTSRQCANWPSIKKSTPIICRRASSPSCSAISQAASPARSPRSACTPSWTRARGGHINKITTRDIVRLVEFEGDEWLFYKVAPVTVAFIRGTTAEPMGDITMEKEPLTLNNLAMAIARRTRMAS